MPRGPKRNRPFQVIAGLVSGWVRWRKCSSTDSVEIKLNEHQNSSYFRAIGLLRLVAGRKSAKITRSDGRFPQDRLAPPINV